MPKLRTLFIILLTALAADGMRSSVTETMAENRTITYSYDALNRLTVEDACETGSGNDYGYTGQYVYDLAGNRRSRNVTVTYYQDPGNPVREQRISTSYSYYSDDNGETDRLHTESHSITQISLVVPDEQIYLYASNGGEFHYTKGLDGKRLSQVHAMLLGLPTKLGSRLFYIAMALVVATFFAPVIASGYIKLRKCQPETLPVNLSLYHRCVLVFLAYALLVGPFGFEQLSHADIQYQDLLASDWGTDGEIITYTYDRNGSIATKVVNDGGPVVTYTNEYNLRNRLAKLTKSTSGQSSEHVTEYKYNPEGIRVCAYSYDTTDGGQTKSNEKTIDYLIDAYNHTGYAQTLVEDDGTDQTTYIIGSDVLAQATNSNNPEYLLYDGHGSTRQLLASNGSTVSDSYSLDAYGVMLGGNPQTPAGTNLLYSGEHFDTDAQHYYLRARWYNQNTGRFNRMDTFAGNKSDPQSLHKYLYCHANPVNHVDPTGCQLPGGGGGFTLTDVLIVSGIMGILSGIIAYELTGSITAAVIVGLSVAMLTFIALGGIGLAITAITGGAFVAQNDGTLLSRDLLNATSWENAERMLSRVLQATPNRARLIEEGMTTYRIPDFAERFRFIADSKWYSTPLSNSDQLRDFAILSRVWEAPLYIYVRVNTHVAQPLIDLVQETGGQIIRIFK